ncbi:hypothetical protein RSAG8_10999, partial [Rhizoctonia solani AG-8 WAC10335]
LTNLSDYTMGFNARPSAANSRRSRVQTSTYSNSSYSNLPATSFATEHSRSRLPRYNHTVAQGIHLASHSLKVPSRGVVQPRHGTRPQSRYPYTPADATPQNWNGQELLSGRDHQKRQARDRERSAPINNFPSATPDATVKHAVAMAFVPEQPAKRAIAFESSLFQRNDPSVALPKSYQRTPLSELNLSSSILLPRYPNSPPPKYAHLVRRSLPVNLLIIHPRNLVFGHRPALCLPCHPLHRV